MGADRRPLVAVSLALLTAALCLTSTAASQPASFPRWVEPEFRVNNAPTVWDPVDGRLLLFRQAGSGEPVQVWTFQREGAPQWQLVPTGGATPAFLIAGMAAAYDVQRHRVLVFAASIWSWSVVAESEVWSLHLGGAPHWERIEVPGAGPAARVEASIALLPEQNRLLLFGGFATPVPGGSGGASSYLNDTWLLDLGSDPAWAELLPAGPLPPPRRDARLAFDPTSRLAVLLGGRTVNYSNAADAWVFSIDDTTWSPLLAQGDAPTSISPHALLFDPKRAAFIAVTSAAGHVRTDLLTLGASPRWEALPIASAPVARTEGAAHLDRPHDRLILAGGLGPHAESLDHLWVAELSDGRTWDNWTPSINRPSPRSFHAGVWLEPQRSVAYLGGSIGTGNYGQFDRIIDSELWLLSPGGRYPNWSIPPLPDLPELGSRSSPGLVHDSKRNRLIALVEPDSFGFTCWPCNRVWSYEFCSETGWRRAEVEGPAPEIYLLGSFYDERRDRVIVVSRTLQGELEIWGLSLRAPSQWTRLDSGAARPPPRSSTFLALDAAADRVILHGEHSLTTTRLKDTWIFDLGSGQWSELPTSGEPPVPTGACFDRLRNRLLVFARLLLPAVELGVYELPLDGVHEWRRLEPSGLAPLHLDYFPPAYDPRRDRVVIFGGSHVSSIGAPSTDRLFYLEFGSPIVDVELSLNSGARLHLDDHRGRARIHVAILSTPTFDALIVDPASVLFEGAPAIETPGAGERASRERDVNGDGLPDLSLEFRSDQIDRAAAHVVATLSGRTFDGQRIEGLVRVAEPSTSRLAGATLGDDHAPLGPGPSFSVGPNPARGVLRVRFQVTDSAPVRLDVFDLAGRRIVGVDLGAWEVARGEALISVPEEGPSGLYWIRFTQGGRVEHARIALVR